MVRNTEHILIDALQLPQSERAALAARLIASLDEIVEEDVDESWLQEVQSRHDELATGKTQPVRWTEMKQRLEQQVDALESQHPSSG